MFRIAHRRLNLKNVALKFSTIVKNECRSFPRFTKNIQYFKPRTQSEECIYYSTSSKDPKNTHDDNTKSSSDDSKKSVDTNTHRKTIDSTNRTHDRPKKSRVAHKSKRTPKDSNNNQNGKNKKVLALICATLAYILFYAVCKLGQPEIDEDGNVIEDEFSELLLVKQYFLRTINELQFYFELFKEPTRAKILPDVPKHHYPPYTLVIEFTEVLVHKKWKQTAWRFKIRPGFHHFLRAISGTFEIVVYTAEEGMIVFPVIDAIDTEHDIYFTLVRDSTLLIDGEYFKDLDNLNRDLKKVIVIDWNKNCTRFHPENVLTIPKWSGNNDLTLIHLEAFLMAISQNRVDDVRDVIHYYSKYNDPLTAFRERQKRLIDLAERDYLFIDETNEPNDPDESNEPNEPKS